MSNLYVTGLWPTADYNGFAAYQKLYGGVLAHYDDPEPLAKLRSATDVFAHSFGVWMCLQLIQKYGLKLDYFMAIDAVWKDPLWSGDDFARPAGIAAVTSFKKNWGLPPSVGIVGVKSTIINTWDPFFFHGGMPRRPEVAAEIARVMG